MLEHSPMLPDHLPANPAVSRGVNNGLNSEIEYSSSDENSSNASSDLASGGEWQHEAIKSGELFHVQSHYNETSHKHPGDDATVKIVYVFVERAVFYGKKISGGDLLANMLGIITLSAAGRNKQAIVVDALVPGGVAFRTGYIGLGDILLAVDDVTTSRSNIERLLAQIDRPSSLKLTLKAVDSYNLPPPLGMPTTTTECSVQSLVSEVKLLSPNSGQPFQLLLKPHGIFYLSMMVSSDEVDGNADVVYQFPDGAASSKLCAVRGIFLTVFDLIKETFATGCSALSSTLLVGNEPVHCVYCCDDGALLVMCLPSNLYSLSSAHRTLVHSSQLLTTMYGSLSAAFMRKNHCRINHLFQYVLLLNASALNSDNTVPWRMDSNVHCVSLSLDVRAQVNAVLAELEANDFPSDDIPSNFRRQYMVLSSSLFYDGYLVASHMSREHMCDVALFCYNHGLLRQQLEQQIGLLVVWREVFEIGDKRHRVSSKQQPFKTMRGRHFWLIVGLRRHLLCVLVHMNQDAFPSTHTPRPDPALVNLAHATLLQLNSTCAYNMMPMQLCTISPTPHLAYADKFASNPGTALFRPTGPMTASNGHGLKFPFSSPLKGTKSAMSSDSDAGSRTPQAQRKSKDERRSLIRNKSFGSQQLVGDNSVSLTVPRTAMSSPAQLSPYRQVTGGAENTLFCFLDLDMQRGILLAPTRHDIHMVNGVIHRQLVNNFQRCTATIHQRFAADDDLVEEAVLFRYSSSLKKQAVQYWVVGRRLRKPHSRELYVCFHDSSQQNAVELAFRLIY